MNQIVIPFKTKCCLAITIALWASAFVGIRAGLESYSPGGLALLRFIIASLCMCFITRSSRRSQISTKDKIALLFIGALGLGVYNIFLNVGEVSIPSGIASFIIGQSPIITTIFAILFLGESSNPLRFIGMGIGVLGILLISIGETKGFQFSIGVLYILAATMITTFYSIIQKPFLKKYHTIEVTTYIVWGATLMLLIFAPNLPHEIASASLRSSLAIIYLGIFPAAIANLTWSYALAAIPASRAATSMYFMPIVATLLGWLWLGEVPPLLSFAGGVVALFGVWVVNQSYARQIKLIEKNKINEITNETDSASSLGKKEYEESI